MLYNYVMQKFTELNENKNLVLVLGFFDGVHIGHKEVIVSAVEYAKKYNLKSALLTFDIHPLCFFKNIVPQYISQNREKIIQDLGIDYFYEIKFDNHIAKMEPKIYIKDILEKYFAPKAIFTGFNHTFGVDKKGTPEILTKYQKEFNYEYFEIPPQKFNDEVISSTRIRNGLINGDIELANSMLGRKFNFSSMVIEGQKIGRTLGFKTANIIYPKNIINIPFGVYEVITNHGKGIANFGIRPTVNNSNEPVLEIHILNFDKDIYGETLSVEFVKKIRDERKFNSVNELKEQIQKDISAVTS